MTLLAQIVSKRMAPHFAAAINIPKTEDRVEYLYGQALSLLDKAREESKRENSIAKISSVLGSLVGGQVATELIGKTQSEDSALDSLGLKRKT